MSDVFYPLDWFWRRDDGVMWSSALGRPTVPSDPQPPNFTIWPRDDAGQQTDAALNAVLNVYGLPGPGTSSASGPASGAQDKKRSN